MTERWRANGEEWISRWSWFCLEQGKLVSGADLIWSGSSLGGVMSCHLVWSVVWCWTLTLISPSWSSVLLEFCVFNLIFRFPPPPPLPLLVWRGALAWFPLFPLWHMAVWYWTGWVESLRSIPSTAQYQLQEHEFPPLSLPHHNTKRGERVNFDI